MKRVVCALILACQHILLCNPAAECADGDTRGSVKVNGKKRTYLLHVPASYEQSKPLPLVLVFHGAFGSASISRWDSRMSEQADKDGFIVAYPRSLQGTWNAGLCCGLSQKKNVDDIAFVRAVVENLSKKYSIDPTRVYAAGVSNGGMFAYKVARELSDVFAATASVEACMYPSPSPGGPISVLALNGTKDCTIPYEGGRGSWYGYKLDVPGVRDTIDYWVKQNGCTSEPTKVTTGAVTKELFSQGKSNTEVCLYTIKGGGHIWPGGRRAKFMGRSVEKEFSATEAICSFFLSHPKPKT